VPVRRAALRLRRHGVVLAGPLLRAGLLCSAATVLLRSGWPLPPLGAAALALAAWATLRAVGRWERTLVLITRGDVRVVHGTLRRRSRSVERGAGPVEVDQRFVGRLLGYGTVVVGGLELDHMARPHALARLLAQPPATRDEPAESTAAAAAR
jgi:hypothetical protein